MRVFARRFSRAADHLADTGEKCAVAGNAECFLLMHNHPSNDVSSSSEDLEITRRLRQVGELVGIRVLDHVIIGADTHFSFVDAGYW